VPIPKVTILEYNASPDFHQSGERLRPKLAEMFQGIIRISIAPFFGLSIDDDNEEKEGGDWEVGTEKWGWRLVGQGQVRGPGI
jgi:tubulin--tyrosine ligase